jgi:hypothetical protein
MAILQLGDRHTQEWQATIQKNYHGEKGNDPLAEGERRHAEAQPFLDHRRVKQHRDGQYQANPEAVAEEPFVPGVIGVGFVFSAGGGLTPRVLATGVSHRSSLICGYVTSWMLLMG